MFAAPTAERLEEDRLETELLAYAQQKAAGWGAARFAAEFRRRTEEERMLRDAERRAQGELPPAGEGVDLGLGLVTSEVAEHVVGSFAADLELKQPMRHAHVPRPPATELEPEPERERRRGRVARRKRSRRDRPSPEPATTVSAQEAALMSPAGRRLYGLEG